MAIASPPFRHLHRAAFPIMPLSVRPREIRYFLAACLALAGQGCTSTGSIEEGDGLSPQPAEATYTCEGGETIRVENGTTHVRVADAEGALVELPASPPDQRNRYSLEQHAIVLEDREALYMAPGQSPLPCKR